MVRTGHRQASRFTLLELVMVMALVAGLLAIACPYLGSFLQARYPVEEVRRLLALAERASAEAASSSEIVEFWLDPETGAYGLSRSETDEPVVIERYELAEGLGLTIEPKEHGADSILRILCLPDGTLEAGALTAIHIESQKSGGRICTLLYDAEHSCFALADDS